MKMQMPGSLTVKAGGINKSLLYDNGFAAGVISGFDLNDPSEM